MLRGHATEAPIKSLESVVPVRMYSRSALLPHPAKCSRERWALKSGIPQSGGDPDVPDAIINDLRIRSGTFEAGEKSDISSNDGIKPPDGVKTR